MKVKHDPKKHAAPLLTEEVDNPTLPDIIAHSRQNPGTTTAYQLWDTYGQGLLPAVTALEAQGWRISGIDREDFGPQYWKLVTLFLRIGN